MKAILILIPFLCSGCVSYQHTRTQADGSRETTSFFSCLMYGRTSGVTSAVQDGSYSRTIGVGRVETGTEVEKLGPLTEAIAAGVVKGMMPK